MPTADYSSFHQPSGTGADGTKFDNFVDAVQATVNGLDKNNLAAAAGILASQLADPTTGKVLGSSGSACAAVFPPGFEIVYLEATGFTVITATTEATAQSIVSSGAVTFDGTSVVLEFFVPRVALTSTSGSSVTAYLYADGVSVGILSQIVNPGATLSSGVAVPVRATRRLTPSAGSHTYSVRFAGSVSGAEVDAGAGGTGAFLPGFIRITKA